MTVGERIRKRREELGLTQEEVAEKLGYKSRSSVNKIECARNIPLAKVERMAKVLEIAPAYLMGWETTEETFTENITENRRRLGLTYTELAEKLGVQATNIIAWENGERKPNRQMINKMCQIFGKTYDEMYGLSKSSDDEITIESSDLKQIILELKKLSPDNQKRVLTYIKKLQELEALEELEK